MHEAFRSILLADPEVAALVGTRVAWGSRPQGGTLPAVVLHMVSDVPSYTLAADTGQRQSRVQTDCYGTDYLSALNVSRAVTGCLSGYAGAADGTMFQGIFQDSARDLSEEAPEGGRVFLLSMDFIASNHPQE